MDRSLDDLITAVYQAPEGSLEQKRAMYRLLTKLQQLPGLARSTHPEYLEALNRTWEWVSRNLHLFKPKSDSIEADMLKWINGYLKWRIRDLYSLNQPSSDSLDELVWGSETGQTYLDQLSETGLSTPTLTGLDSLILELQRQQQQRIGLQLQQQIQADVTGELRACCPKAHPDCNCYFLSQKLLIQSPAATLTEISREQNINYQSLVAHWKRKCLPKLQKIATNLGYQP